MDYCEAKNYIKKAVRFGSKLGLEAISALCARLGSPQDTLRFVHVAGTNGKGSVCAMISSILQKAGYKTGLFLSPHMSEHRDSLRINGDMMGQDVFAVTMTDVKTAADTLASEGICATEFELLTACALLWFCRSGCDIVVLETGLGGRLDATNVVTTTLVSVITAISMDHMQYLGDTIRKITREKCGIIKPGGVTVCYPEQSEEAVDIIRAAAVKNGNIIIIPDIGQLETEDCGLEGTQIAYRGRSARLHLQGSHQTRNAVTAIETVWALRERFGFHLPDEAIVCGLEAAYLPARQEILTCKPLIMLDGAHNLQGIEALADTIRASFAGRRLAVVMGMLRDKQYNECIAVMARLSGRFCAVQPDNPRALDAAEVAEVAKAHGGAARAYDNADDAVRAALEFCGEEGAVVICGSLYMADQMRKVVLQQNSFVKRHMT